MLLCREAQLLNLPELTPEDCGAESPYPLQPRDSQKPIINHWACWRAARSTSQYLRIFNLFPHASFSFLLTHCRHTKCPSVCERYLQSQASKWPEFPCDLLTPSGICRAFLGYVLTEIFLRLLWLKQSHSSACTWKVYICLECDCSVGAGYQLPGTRA